MSRKKTAERPELTETEREERKALKAAKFRELAEARMQAAIRRIRMIARLGNRVNYVYTEDQSRKILAALDKALSEVKHAFGSGTQPELFTL